jgi:amino acid permease
LILSTIKILGVIGFIIMGIVIDCGGTGSQGYMYGLIPISIAEIVQSRRVSLGAGK